MEFLMNLLQVLEVPTDGIMNEVTADYWKKMTFGVPALTYAYFWHKRWDRPTGTSTA